MTFLLNSLHHEIDRHVLPRLDTSSLYTAACPICFHDMSQVVHLVVSPVLSHELRYRHWDCFWDVVEREKFIESWKEAINRETRVKRAWLSSR